MTTIDIEFGKGIDYGIQRIVVVVVRGWSIRLKDLIQEIRHFGIGRIDTPIGSGDRRNDRGEGKHKGNPGQNAKEGDHHLMSEPLLQPMQGVSIDMRLDQARNEDQAAQTEGNHERKSNPKEPIQRSIRLEDCINVLNQILQIVLDIVQLVIDIRLRLIDLLKDAWQTGGNHGRQVGKVTIGRFRF